MSANVAISLPAVLSGLQVVDEDGYVTVDTEAELDQALEEGRNVRLRGEGNEGVIDCTSVKTVVGARSTIEGPGHLRFVGMPADERCLLVQAPDVVLRDFEMSSTGMTQTGINFPAVEPAVAHRAKLQRLHLHNWGACVTKYGGTTSPYIDDILMEDCYCHTFQFGGYMTFGVRRMLVRRCRFIGKLAEDVHTTWNAWYGAANLEDCRFEQNEFGEVDRMGIELTTVVGATLVRPALVDNRINNCGTYGISLGHPQGAYVERNTIRNVRDIGIEMGGAIQPVGWATVINNDVEGVTNHPAGNGEATAYIFNRMRDSVMRGNRAAAVTSTANPVWAYGVYVFESERCTVMDGEFMDAGALQIYVNPGSTPNTGGFHVLAGNTFRHTVNVAGGAAIHVGNTTAAVRNNTAWQKTGWDLGFRVAASSPARVDCEAGSPVVSGAIGGSNLVLAVP